MRKVPEIIMFQALGIIETLGSIISHGTSSKFADVRTHLRKVSNLIRASFSLYLHNLTIAPRGDPKDDQVGDEKDGTDTEGHDEDLATIDDTEHFENESDHMVGKGQVNKGKDEREEKDSPYLTVDGPFDLVFIEPHLLEDDEALTVFIAFRNLLVVDDDDRSDHKDQ